MQEYGRVAQGVRSFLSQHEDLILDSQQRRVPVIPALGSTDGWIRRLTHLSVSPKDELNPRFRESPGLRKRGEEAMEESTSDGLRMHAHVDKLSTC